MKGASRPPPTPPSRMTHPWTRSPTKPRRVRNAGSCSPRPRLWSWRDASVSSATCPARRGSSWPVSSAWPRPRSRSGSRTTATRWKEAGEKACCRTRRYRSPRCCAGSSFRFWSEMGNLFTPACLTRRKRPVYLPPQRHPFIWPTRLFSIRPPSLCPPGTTSTFPPRRPPDWPGETFGATRSTLTLSSEGLIQCTNSFRIASNVFWMFLQFFRAT